MDTQIKFKRKIWISGGSKVISLPTEILEAYGLNEGDTVMVHAGKNKEIIISKEASL